MINERIRGWITTRPGKVPANTTGNGSNCAGAFANITNAQAGGNKFMK